MCLIMICTGNYKKPTLEMLKKVNDENPDGFGISHFVPNGAKWKKGMNVEEAYDYIQKLDTSFVLHARKASVGSKEEKLLNHPFLISRESPLSLEGVSTKHDLLFHNGTIKEIEYLALAAGIEIPANVPMSDTRLLAIILSRHKRGSETVSGLLNKINDKFVRVDIKKRMFYYCGYFQDEDDKTILYSNTFWKWKNYGTTTSTCQNDYSKNYETITGFNPNRDNDRQGDKQIGKSRKEKKRDREFYQRQMQSTTPSQTSLALHGNKFDNELSIYKCYICAKYIPQKRIDAQKVLSVKEIYYTCFDCAYKYYNKSRLPIRINIDNNSESGKSFINKLGDQSKKILHLPSPNNPHIIT